MPINLEWRIPWPADWPLEKKVRAAERILGYMTQGTFFDPTTRMIVTDAKVVQHTKHSAPFIQLRLER